MKVKVELGKNGAWFVSIDDHYIADFINKDDAIFFAEKRYPGFKVICTN